MKVSSDTTDTPAPLAKLIEDILDNPFMTEQERLAAIEQAKNTDKEVTDHASH